MHTLRAAGAPTQFASGLRGQVLGVLGGGLVSIVLGFLFARVALAGWAEVRNNGVLIFAFVAVVATGVIASVIRSFVTGPVRILVSADRVEVMRGRRVQHQLPRSEYAFGSYVTRQNNRVTERKLVATSSIQRLELVCAWFEAGTFDELIATLAPLVSEAPAHAGAMRTPVGNRVYTLNPRGRSIAAMVGLALVLTTAAMITAGLVTLAMFEPPTSSQSEVIALMVTGAAALLIGVPIVILLRRVASIRSIPRRIEISGAGVVIDNRPFTTINLTRVSLTPPSYAGQSKRLRLTESNGAKATYLLETGGLLARTPVFAEYAEFADHLTRALPAEVVRFELG